MKIVGGRWSVVSGQQDSGQAGMTAGDFVFSIPHFLDSRFKHAGMTTRNLQLATCIYFQGNYITKDRQDKQDNKIKIS